MAFPESAVNPTDARTLGAPAPAPARPKGALPTLAMIVSYLFHPVFFPVAMGVALYFLAPDQFAGVSPKQARMWLLIVALLTMGFPLLTTAMLRGLGFIRSFQMRDSRERIIPLMASMIFYFWVSYVFLHFADKGSGFPAPRIIQVMLLGAFYGIIGCFMANIFFKISLHACAAGGMVAVLIILMLQSPANLLMPLLAGIFLAGLVGTARMILKEHQPGDLVMGYVVGFAAQWAAYGYLS